MYSSSDPWNPLSGEARQLQHGSWSAEVQDGTRVLEFSHPLTSWKGRTVVLDHVWLCYVAHQAPLSMKFPRQEYWSRLLLPTPGDLPNPKDQTCVSCIGRWIVCHWATGKPTEEISTFLKRKSMMLKGLSIRHLWKEMLNASWKPTVCTELHWLSTFETWVLPLELPILFQCFCEEQRV